MSDPEFIDMSPYADRPLPPEIERAWAAGFFDGEGWIGSHKTKDYTYLKMAVVQTGSTVTLERFNAAIGGVGSIYERSRRVPEHWSPGWSLQVNAIDRVVFAVNLIWPWLSQPKRDQAIAAFATRAAYRATWRADFKLPQQRLTDDQVREIRVLCANGARKREVAEMFGIDVSNVYRIVKRQFRSNVV
jgi:hypothetical protein